MKKSLLAGGLVLILGITLQDLGPWWLIAFIAFFICSVISLKPHQAFMVMLLVGFLLWCGQALYSSHLNEGILAEKIGQLFGGLSGGLLMIIAGLIGGLLAGLGGLSGSYLRKLIDKQSKK